MNEVELNFRKETGHSSICNKVRRFRGRTLVNKHRMCTCRDATGFKDGYEKGRSEKE